MHTGSTSTENRAPQMPFGLSIRSSFTAEIAEEYQKFLVLCKSDREMAFVRARRTMEIAVRHVFRHIVRAPGRSEPLESIVTELRSKGYLPDGVFGELSLIKDYGNSAAHGTLDSVEGGQGDNRLEVVDASLNNALSFLFARHKAILQRLREDPPALVVVHGAQIGEDGIRSLFRLAQEVYGAELIQNPDGMLRRYEANPEIFHAVMDMGANAYVGFLSAVPIETEAFERTLHPDFHESDVIPGRVRRYLLPGLYQVYIASIAVAPSYRGSAAYMRLFYGFIDYIVDLADRGIVIDRLSADAISDEGNQMCHNLKMVRQHLRSPTSSLYLGRLIPLEMKLTGEAGKKLEAAYAKIVD